MTSNLDRYKADLDALIRRAGGLENSMQHECLPKEFEAAIVNRYREIPEIAKELVASRPDEKKIAAAVLKFIASLPSFTADYQSWYSEAMAVVKQILPDRLTDFVRHYEIPKSRKAVTYDNYFIEDYLQGLRVTRGGVVVVDGAAAIPRFRQQVAILKSCRARFESSLFETRQLVQADLFDSELDAAKELSKHRFTRAAGAVAGVVLERHLAQVCANHAVKITKPRPTISVLNDALRAADVIDVPNWRFIQRLADIRNLCDHNRSVEPTQEQVDEVIDGVAKVSKTIF